MHPESVELRLEKLKQDQELILDRVDNAIALFDYSHKLVLFNQKLSQIWGFSPEWLQSKPTYETVFAELVTRGFWSEVQKKQLASTIEPAEVENVSYYIEQSNGVCLEVYVTVTSDGGRLCTFRDVTTYQQTLKEAALIQANLNAEVRRLAFLLSLTERLQPATELREIGQFALSYLVEVMGAAFGDVKVITGEGIDRQAAIFTNQISGQFIATYGEVAVAEMRALLDRGVPYGQGLLWEVVETGKPIFVEDYYKHPKALAGFRHPAIGQLGIFPIPAADGTIIGVLTLESRSLQKLQEAPQQDMLMAACRTLGVAIERAQAEERLRQINEDLERASQMKSEFLASMSHELRTPLNSILGFSDLLMRQSAGSLSDRQIGYVQTIEKSGQHLLQLINDILDLSKIEAGKTELYPQPISIQYLCTECLKMIQPRADKKRLALSLEIDYRLNKANLDERRVSQILINLLSNAVKFTPEGGQIKLASKLAYGSDLAKEYRPDRSPINPTTPYLCLEVKDSGIGIAREKWHLLFRPFQQVDASLTRRHEGTGLGLALTKRLAELHGGTVSLESVENQGSAFRIWLPLTEMWQESTINGQLSSVSDKQQITDKQLLTDRKRVLVVEDQVYNQALISEVLELEGYAVELIYDGSTMIDLVYSALVTPESLPDLILMDIQLPEVDGFEIIRHLKAHPLWQNVPVIAVTAIAMAGDRDRCLAAGANGYLSKPLNLDELISTVRSFLNKN
ncbi:hybrid sensor histidine kinase/response regulator [Aerosakkonema funiforme]|uniref:Circadian input-output histidine kinase CikA n=1 Tax=Aerosakkonema funiforme FACHB-1375 TaxID=2949571 RepID=A0A926VHK7_9CYAN|nr:response regulator [Aerosakkonema funiforme]MBD2183883.1 response regulator [Aerosakkonema funiforme FACHB-1375]